MSDCFDHEWDAWESRIDEDQDNDPQPFVKDELFYHQKVVFHRLVSENEKFYTIELKGKTRTLILNIPKKACKKFKPDSVWVHKLIYQDIFKKALLAEKSKTEVENERHGIRID